MKKKNEQETILANEVIEPNKGTSASTVELKSVGSYDDAIYQNMDNKNESLTDLTHSN